MMPLSNRTELRNFRREQYTVNDIEQLTSMLHAKGTFSFPRMANGLFPAASGTGTEFDCTGYAYVWVRDNIYIALSHWLTGQPRIAVENVRALMRYFSNHRQRLDDVVAGKADYSDPMQRPHIRFNGENLSELDEKWAHAQNDALGYFMWLFSSLALAGELTPTPNELELLTTLARYFETVRFWADEDSGHWEETRKVSASSIGVATAGLKRLHELLGNHPESSRIERLIDEGERALHAILPAECIQTDSSKARRYDAALLFLIWPMQIVDDEMADRILADVREHLSGDYGIRRYLGDSYWCADYKTLLGADERTADFSDDLARRDRLLKPGTEAQWCIFDPIVSIIYGRRFQQSRDPANFERQTHFLNRSLGQLTDDGGRFPAFRCPESYFCERGRYVPNDITPLLWTQANLAVALRTMLESAKLSET